MNNPSTPPHPPVNHVFVDFENVQRIDLKVLDDKAVNFTLLLGPTQKKLDVEIVEKLLQHPVSVRLVRLTAAAKNALDFTLAYYVGREVAADPAGYFHIVSKDTGYDPLIAHLKKNGIRIERHPDFSTLTLSPRTAVSQPHSPKPAPSPLPEAKPASKSKPAPDPMEEKEGRVLKHLEEIGSKRPRTKSKLLSYVITHLGRDTNAIEAAKLVDRISQTGMVLLAENEKVIYPLWRDG